MGSLLLFVLVVLGIVINGVQSVVPGYKLNGPLTNSSSYLTGQLSVISPPHVYDADISPLQVNVYFETEYRLRVKIFDPNNQRWEVPGIIQETPKAKRLANVEDSLYSFSYTQNPFSFSISRKSSQQVLFNTYPKNFNGLIFEDPYIELNAERTGLGSIYGLGEHTHALLLSTNKTYTLFNKDQGGVPENANLYGSHPFYLETLSSGESHGVFLLNSNAMDVTVFENGIKYQTIGGILDFYFFLGPSPEQVIQQYHELIGLPYFPPYWSLGFHQCRWGYISLSETKTVVEEYKKHKIPLEVMWNDIDYMSEFRDFTYGDWLWGDKEVKKFVDDLHKNGQRYVIITDPGLVYEDNYIPTQKLLEINGYIKDKYGDPLVNVVWPGFTIFPDFTNPNTSDFWIEMISNFHNSEGGLSGPNFDGLWIDMNEISGLCDGECNPFSFSSFNSSKEKENLSKGLGFDPDNPPFLPGGEGLDRGTTSLSGQQYLSTSYNLHNLYSILEAKATSKALEQIKNERSFVLSRSTFSGSGKYTFHWLGDNYSSYKDMYNSIPGILNFNIFGVPMVGADICGFNGETTKELCTRWIEVGSFYPFCRNHNAIFMESQELYKFGEDVVNISRQVLFNRYQLIPYYYTLFFRANTQGGTVARPLFFEFPQDPLCRGIDKQFLIGRGLLVSPVLEEGATTVQAYFPKDTWYDYYTGTVLSQVGNVTLPAPINEIRVHVRGGIVIPTQQPAMTLKEARTLPFSLLVALDNQGNAEGELYWDNGVELSVVENQHYTLISYQASTTNQKTTLSSSLSVTGFDMSNLTLDQVKVYGVGKNPSTVTVNGASFSNFTYNSQSQVLLLSGVGTVMSKPFSISWS